MSQGNRLKRERPGDSKCCGVVEAAAARSRENREARAGPQPWIMRKSMIAFTLGLMGYSVYVYVGRLCVDMIRQKPGAGGSRSTGIALLVVFCVLFLWMMWAYIKVVITPPGVAKDHVPKSDRPPYSEPQPFIPYDYDVEGPRSPNARPSESHRDSRDVDQDSIGGPSYENIHARMPVVAPDIAANASTSAEGDGNRNGDISNIPTKPASSYGREKSAARYISRRPWTTPILRPENRYCPKDQIVKPHRTHHCRSCGTCILKYDHHCPWIGQCVGARNQKFFVNFVQAASVYTIYVFVTLIVFTVRSARSPQGRVDPQRIVVIALAALLALFTTLLLLTHARLIWLGQTTLENLQARSMKERESRVMTDVLGWCAFREKLRTKRVWDAEWGRIDREGNIWWLGSGKKEWVDVMGKNPLGWCLPIGKSLNDGLTYPVNPRFDEQGIWRRRVEWPQELR
ncbi:putative DHHC palmitoyltransferase family protein [Lyophyllum shimeji]|uniref:Palmitoyltransferase n=1 Tax=Lyophyllum shimeji TaxID=47721 RepID=A0A9P3Q0G6_LYOSH|nr:putative DHHC palmitoyltransferase family protein [Lyophyllum shimeji]